MLFVPKSIEPAGAQHTAGRQDPSPADAATVPPDLIRTLLKTVAALWNLEEQTARICVDKAIDVLHVEGAKHSYPAENHAPFVGGLAPWQARLVSRYIANNIQQPIRLDTLANIVQLSGSQFRRSFKVSFGHAPHAYILHQRVALAQEMMITGAGSLSEIALACGFADQSHFNRVFLRITRETPKAWRRTRQIPTA